MGKKEFKYLWSFYISDGKLEREMEADCGHCTGPLWVRASIYVPTPTYGHEIVDTNDQDELPPWDGWAQP